MDVLAPIEIFEKADDGKYWKFLDEKKLDRLRGIMLSPMSALTRLIPNEATINILKDMEEPELMKNLNRFVISNAVESLDKFTTSEPVLGGKLLKLARNDNGTIQVVGSDAYLYDLDGIDNTKNPHLTVYGISGLIADESLSQNQHAIKKGGALTMDTRYEDDESLTTRKYTLKDILKTAKRYNLSFLANKGAHMMAMSASMKFVMDKDILYPTPITLLLQFITQKVVHENMRINYSFSNMSHSLILNPWNTYMANFINPKFDALLDSDHAKFTYRIKYEMPDRDVYTYDELISALKSLYPPDTKNIENKLKFDWIYYNEINELKLILDDAGPKASLQMYNKLFKLAHNLFNIKDGKEDPFKKQKFGIDFVKGPCFMHSAINKKSALELNNEYATKQVNVIDMVNAYLQKCRESEFKYSLDSDIVTRLVENYRTIDERIQTAIKKTLSDREKTYIFNAINPVSFKTLIAA